LGSVFSVLVKEKNAEMMVAEDHAVPVCQARSATMGCVVYPTVVGMNVGLTAVEDHVDIAYVANNVKKGNVFSMLVKIKNAEMMVAEDHAVFVLCHLTVSLENVNVCRTVQEKSVGMMDVAIAAATVKQDTSARMAHAFINLNVATRFVTPAKHTAHVLLIAL
jgi:hypothetical protein